MAADALVAAWRYIRLADRNAGDFAMNAREAFELLQLLKALLHDGGVFHETADGLLTHKVLTAIKGRTVLLGRGTGTERAISLSWPCPVSSELMAPVEIAQRRLPPPPCRWMLSGAG